MTQSPNGSDLLAQPVDPKMLADLPGFEPIDFGHHYTYTMSADRETLVGITWPSGANNADGQLI